MNQSELKKVIPAIILSRSDYCHSPLSSTSKRSLSRLQVAQNAAEWLLTGFLQTASLAYLSILELTLKFHDFKEGPHMTQPAAWDPQVESFLFQNHG